MKIFTHYKNLIFASFLTITLAGCFGDDDNDYRKPVTPVPVPLVSIVEVAAANDNFSTLVSLLEATDLDAVLDDLDSTFTVFAPTNDAFAALGQDTLDALQADPDTLAAILTYHVLSGEVNSAAAVAAVGTTVETVNGASVGVSLQGDALFINLSAVTTADIETDNGVIHAIDAVLMPPAVEEPTQTIAEIVVASEDFETLEAALTAASLVGAFEDTDATFTVFAPTDDAFASINPDLLAAIIADEAVLTAILGQHVVPGTAVDAVTAFSLSGNSVTTLDGVEVALAMDTDSRTLTIGGSTITVTDVRATNGIIHVIDTVILGDVDLPDVFGSLVDVAAANPDFSTLVSLLQQTELDDVLGNLEQTFTVFAPTNAAFEALGQDALDALANNSEALANVLLYHVLPGAVNATTATGLAGTTVEAANGSNLALTLQGEDLFVNLAKVTGTDVPADNGIIHVIDAVLVPVDTPEEIPNIAEIVAGSDDFETLLAALTEAGLGDVFADETRSFTVFAPTDDAFAAIPGPVLDAILDDTELLSALLLQHVVEDSVVDSVTALSLSGSSVATLSGAQVAIEVDAELRTLKIGGATVTVSDVFAANGIVHIIDAVIVGDLTLPTASIVDVAAANENFSTLVSLLELTALDGVLGDLDASFTVFAPTNEAFAALGQETLDALADDPDTLADILTYHVLPGEVNSVAAINAAGTTVETVNGANVGVSLQGDDLFVNLSQVTEIDTVADNGVVHAIDAVLLPPAVEEATQTIAEIVVTSEDFETLETALAAANLVSTFENADATFTVFAPTDDAFAAIDAGLLDAILADQTALTAILAQHVVADAAVDAVTAFSLSGSNVTTLNGVEVALTIDTDSRTLTIGGSTITVTDVRATNGIIHVIDTVIVGDVPLPQVN